MLPRLLLACGSILLQTGTAAGEEGFELPLVNFNRAATTDGTINPNNELRTATAQSSYHLSNRVSLTTGRVTRFVTTSGTLMIRLRNSNHPGAWADFSVQTTNFVNQTAFVLNTTSFLSGPLHTAQITQGSIWSLEPFISSGVESTQTFASIQNLRFRLTSAGPIVNPRVTFEMPSPITPPSAAFTETGGPNSFTATTPRPFIVGRQFYVTNARVTALAPNVNVSSLVVFAYNSDYPGQRFWWRPWQAIGNLADAVNIPIQWAGISGPVTGDLNGAYIRQGSTWSFVLAGTNDRLVVNQLTLGFPSPVVDDGFVSPVMPGPFNVVGQISSPQNSVITLPPVTTPFVMGRGGVVSGEYQIFSGIMTQPYTTLIRVRNSAYPGTWSMDLGATVSITGVFNQQWIESPSSSDIWTNRLSNTLRGLLIPENSVFSVEFAAPAAPGTTPVAQWRNFRLQLLQEPASPAGSAPPATDLGILNGARSVPVPPLSANQTLWYRFEVAQRQSRSSGGFWTAYTESTANTTLSNDYVMGLFDMSGRPIAFDDDSGLGSNASLTFGAQRQTPWTVSEFDLPLDGRDSEGLEEGVYYLAVSRWSPPPITFDAPFQFPSRAAATTTGGFLRIETAPTGLQGELVQLQLSFPGTVEHWSTPRTFRYRWTANGQPVGTSGTLVADQPLETLFIALPPQASNLELAIEGPTFLSASTPWGPATSPGTGIEVTLVGGDVNSDNTIDLADLDQVIADLYLMSEPAHLLNTDVDHSGEVDLTDLDLIIGRYLTSGDN